MSDKCQLGKIKLEETRKDKLDNDCSIHETFSRINGGGIASRASSMNQKLLLSAINRAFVHG